MSQNKTWSVIEIITGTGIKFIAAMFIWQFVVAPLYGYAVTLSQNVGMTLIFAVNSIIIGYLLRRLFNYLGD